MARGFQGAGVPEHASSAVALWAYLLFGTWALLGPGMEPVLPTLQGGSSTPGPPGKPQQFSFFKNAKESTLTPSSLSQEEAVRNHCYG